MVRASVVPVGRGGSVVVVEGTVSSEGEWTGI